jgi:hypothetical protein
MNPIANIWNHPRTSAAGLLIAVVTVAGVFSQQGVTFGKAGAGTVITLLSAVATALLGLLARDPGSPAPQESLAGGRTRDQGPGQTLGVIAFILLLLASPLETGCNATTVAQDIVNWTPSLQSAVATVDSTAALLAPADAPIFAAATTGFDAASNLLVAQAKAYLANPTASVLTQLQTQIVAFQQQVDAALLQAAKIVNPASQQHALAAIQAVGTIVTALLALVESISSKSSLARMAADSHLKLAAVRPYFNEQRSAQMVAAHYGEPLALARMQVARAEQQASDAGF